MARRLKVPVIEIDGGRCIVREHGKEHAPRPRFHSPEGERRRREPWRVRYGEAGYQRERQACIERARGRCQSCGKVGARRSQDGTWGVFPGFACHHTVKLANGGEGAPLAFLCRPCHWRADHQEGIGV